MTAPGPPAVGPSRPARPRGGVGPRPDPAPPWRLALFLALIAAGIGLRVVPALQPGLWADEVFSLAMATGHSLEHPAAAADPGLGDFVEPAEPRPATLFRSYAEHGEHPAGFGRVVRAVTLSDTNPPLYYLLLNPWTRVFGTGDATLRLFSVAWAVLALPLLWLVGRAVGGTPAGWIACVLFSFAPVAVYYSYEGRMYSLLWFLALGLAWPTLELATEQEGGPRRLVLWVLAGTAGLLTHYFFVFVWLASAGWLLLRTSPAIRRRVLAAATATAALALPWYLGVPASLARWRVSGGWLDGALAWPAALARPATLAGELLGGASYLGGWSYAGPVLGTALVLLLAALALGGSWRYLFTAPGTFLWGWLAAACAGPLLFDLLRHTTTSAVPRYALSGLPAAILLASVALTRVPPARYAALTALVLAAWLPGARRAAFAEVLRPSQPYRELDARLAGWERPGDLVIVSSIPSGVVATARYLEPDLPLLARVPGLSDRDPARDLPAVLAGHRRVALVKVTRLGSPAAAEGWLRERAQPLGEERFRRSSAEVLYFGPAGGRNAFPGPTE